ncbi:hypothetical protein GCM10029978_119060 [Actinoallomurus acanthiterrae]
MCVVHRPDQRRTGAGEHRQPLISDRTRRDLLHGLAHRRPERSLGQCPGHGREMPGVPLIQPGESVHESRVESGHQIQGLLDPRHRAVEQGRQLHTEHQRTAPIAGNQCSSSMGSVVSGSSR